MCKDFRNINKNDYVSWSECYKKNYIYTPGFFIYEIKKQKISFIFFIFFIFSLLLIKTIVKIQIFFIFLFTILNKITVLHIKENSNVLYNLFIFIPYKTSFQINLKKFNAQNLYNLFINISMNTLFFFNRFVIQKTLEFTFFYTKLRENTRGEKTFWILTYKTLKILINTWKFPL